MGNMLNENNTISVIIPTYLRSNELSNLLYSILKQTIKPMEIIIVDDTPNNSIKEVCEKYRNNFHLLGVNVSYVKNPRDRSISIARNLGAILAKGNIVCYVDSDVIIDKEYLKELKNTFEKHPEALGVSGINKECIGIKIGKFEKIAKLFYLLNRSQNSGKILEIPANVDKEIHCEWFEGGAMAFKKNVFNEFKFDEELIKYSFMEDLLFTGQISKTYPKKLIIIAKAKYVHLSGNVGRMEASKAREKKKHYRSCRKHVMIELFGVRGLFIFGWQNLGALFFKTVHKILGKETYTEIYGI